MPCDACDGESPKEAHVGGPRGSWFQGCMLEACQCEEGSGSACAQPPPSEAQPSLLPAAVHGLNVDPQVRVPREREENADAPMPPSVNSLSEWLSSLPRPKGSKKKRFLHVYSGTRNRKDGLAAIFRKRGWEAVELDLCDAPWLDILDNRVFEAMLLACAQGAFDHVMLGIPCNSFSVARMHEDDGPPQLRRRPHEVMGIEDLPPFAASQVASANVIVERSIRIARAAAMSGATWVIENPPSRGAGSERWQARYHLHASLWDVPCVQEFISEFSGQVVRFDQCSMGGKWQKWTQLAYDRRLVAMDHWGAYRCSHAYVGHEAAALGDSSAASAAYPMAMNLLLVHAVVGGREPDAPMLFAAPGLWAGSSKPHATAEEAHAALPELRAPTAHSLRKLEPERFEVLQREPLPIANVPVKAAWKQPPVMLGSPPPSRTTDELIPRVMQAKLRETRVRVAACYEAARRGRWKWARDHRPAPLAATEEDCLCPDVPRGWSWQRRNDQDMWDPVRPSSWPEDPPDTELDIEAIVAYAVEHGFDDMEVISWMAHGYPGPAVEMHTVVGSIHVGALKNIEALMKCAGKDRARGWGQHGGDLPFVWPTLVDPVNVVVRNDKPRMTIDKSMQLTTLFAAYNDHVRLKEEPEIEYVSVRLLGRATAILLTAGAPVEDWGFDVDAYFRKSGKQRAHVWMSGLLYWDGYANDPRIQFGQREAPVRLGRQSTFLRWAIVRELRRLDQAYPTRATAVREWIYMRMGFAERQEDLDRWTDLFFLCLFVDDAGASSISDTLYDVQGRPVMVLQDGRLVHQRRASLHYEAAIGTIKQFGHTDSDGKGVTPRLERVFLGVTTCLRRQALLLSNDKRNDYRALCERALQGSSVQQGIAISRDDLSSIVHRLLHASDLVVLGRVHLFHLRGAMRARTALRSGDAILFTGAQRELRWWVHRLREDAGDAVGVPLAVRHTFPHAMDGSVLYPYSDASRELDSPRSSGAGAWCIVGGEFCYVERRWNPWELASLSINVLEYAAMNMGSFAFMQRASELGQHVSHVHEHTDNTAAESVADRGKPKTGPMHSLTADRYLEYLRGEVYSAVSRITSVDNDIADGLSRGGTMLQDALRMAAESGLQIRRLVIPERYADLSSWLQPSD